VQDITIHSTSSLMVQQVVTWFYLKYVFSLYTTQRFTTPKSYKNYSVVYPASYSINTNYYFIGDKSAGAWICSRTSIKFWDQEWVELELHSPILYLHDVQRISLCYVNIPVLAVRCGCLASQSLRCVKYCSKLAGSSFSSCRAIASRSAGSGRISMAVYK